MLFRNEKRLIFIGTLTRLVAQALHFFADRRSTAIVVLTKNCL